MSIPKFFKQVLWVLFLTVLLLGVPRLAGAFADLFDYTAIDPDGAFMWISVHHIAQAVIFLFLMLIISRVSAIQFGFEWGDSQVGWLYVRIFVLVFSVYTVVSILIVVLSGSFQTLPYPLTARNIAGQLGFQLLLSGPSEELIFRAFAITMLALLSNGTVFSDQEAGVGKAVFRILGGKLSIANLIAAIIFGLAHVGFSFAPFSLSYNAFQVMYAIVLGLFYGVCYERSKSMVYPMIMHSISNVVAVSVSVIAGFIIG
jgi:membrane protease YdiL (CAAX protease family)